MNSNYESILASCWANSINNAPSINDGILLYLKGLKSLPNSYTSSQSYSLYSQNPSIILPYFAFESTKFACASLETMLNINYIDVIHPKSQNWNIIKLYYSAFYAAHSILRSFGMSVTMIDKNTATSIEKKLENSGYALAKASKGEHFIIFNRTLQTLDIQYIGNRGNGTHERFWLEFHKAIEMIRQAVPSAGLPQNDKSDIIKQLDELELILKLQGHDFYSWLSSFRNDVTYKNGFGVWFPYTDELGDIETLNKNLDLWMVNPESISLSGANQLQLFTYACHYLISLCNLNMHILNKLSSHNNNLYRNRYMGLFNMSQIQVSI